MIPIVGALAGLTYVLCPLCGEVQVASRRRVSVCCKACKRSFLQQDGRAELQRALERLRRRK